MRYCFTLIGMAAIKNRQVPMGMWKWIEPMLLLVGMHNGLVMLENHWVIMKTGVLMSKHILKYLLNQGACESQSWECTQEKRKLLFTQKLVHRCLELLSVIAET